MFFNPWRSPGNDWAGAEPEGRFQRLGRPEVMQRWALALVLAGIVLGLTVALGFW
jgi:hypothetical protein